MYTLRTYDLTSASRKVSVNNMAERMEIQWLDGQAKDAKSVEKIFPKRHIRQNQWQSEWNNYYLNEETKWCYDYISDYECIFNHPVSPYTSLEDPTRWDDLQQLKQQGTEIYIQDLAHSTSPDSAEDIIKCEGFRGEEKKINEDAQGDDIIAKFSWWSPLFTEQDKQQVRRTLGDALRPFLDPWLEEYSLTNQFATSDAFMPKVWRYGGTYFKCNINVLCHYYGLHFKGEVKFKILGTFGYKAEVMHAVLVCSEANASGMFRSYPELPLFDNDDVVVKHGVQWIWKPQATGTEIIRPGKYRQSYPIYRRWEHVAFAFHIPDEWGDDPSNEKLMFVPHLDKKLHQFVS